MNSEGKALKKAYKEKTNQGKDYASIISNSYNHLQKSLGGKLRMKTKVVKHG